MNFEFGCRVFVFNFKGSFAVSLVDNAFNWDRSTITFSLLLGLPFSEDMVGVIYKREKCLLTSY